MKWRLGLGAILLLLACGREVIPLDEAEARWEELQRSADLRHPLDLGRLAPLFGSSSPWSGKEREQRWSPFVRGLGFVRGRVVRVDRRGMRSHRVRLSVEGAGRVDVYFASFGRSLEELEVGSLVLCSGILSSEPEAVLRKARIE